MEPERLRALRLRQRCAPCGARRFSHPAFEGGNYTGAGRTGCCAPDTQAPGAVRAHQVAPRGQRPAGPAVMQRAQIAAAQEPQQPHRRPRHPVTPAVPMPDGTDADPEELGARWPVQQARMAQFPETFGTDQPKPATWPTSSAARTAHRRHHRARRSGSGGLTGPVHDFA